MKNTFGNSFSVTISGESHGPAVTVIIDGVVPGVDITGDEIRAALDLRRPAGAVSTSRRENDDFEILSGVFNGKTTGTPVCISIKNGNTRSGDYDAGLMRPGHADYTARLKYGGYEDYRGGGHFSGRITAGICAAGAVAGKILGSRGIRSVSRIKEIAGVSDTEIKCIPGYCDLERLSNMRFPVLDSAAGEKMTHVIEDAASRGDSVGGITETFVFGVPGGLGEPFFDSVESVISHAVFSVPGVKGIAFGGGFALSGMYGSEANDAMYYENGAVSTVTNNSGGILGGIANGMPICFSAAVKPTPSISRTQKTVRICNGTAENADISVRGRHDPCIVHRAVHVINAVTEIAVLDLFQTAFGTKK